MHNTIELLQEMRLEKGQLAVNWIGQGGFVFKTSKNHVICIDPYLSNSVEKFEGLETRRMWFPSFPISSFKPQFVVCTHDHLDHTDPETIPLVAAYSQAVFLGPTEAYEHMKKMNIDSRRLKKFNAGDEYQEEDFKIKAVYAKHTIDSIGVILETENLKIYITGDTEPDERLYELKKEEVDILIVCINGRLGNLNAREACELSKMIGAKKIIPMHYGLIPSNTVRLDEFQKICAELELEKWILERETNYIFQKTAARELKLQKH